MDTTNYHDIFEYKDGNLFWKMKPSLRTNIGDQAGTLNSGGYIQVKYKGKKLLTHRIIFQMHFGFFPKEIDHINRIKTDNRIENLRECTRSENNKNKGMQKNNKSGAKNICWHKQTKKWQLQYNKKYCGLYNTLDEAKKALEKQQNQV
jgi:HNH endonuclease